MAMPWRRQLKNGLVRALKLLLGDQKAFKPLRSSAHSLASTGSHTKIEWEAVRDFYGHRCAGCGVGGTLEKDHIVPLCAGGSDLAINLQPLCKSCNSAKSGRILPGTQLSVFDTVVVTPNAGQSIARNSRLMARFNR